MPSKKLRELERELQSLNNVSPPIQSIPTHPVEFAKTVLGFTPLPYQQRLLEDKNKRIVVRMCRQAGKTTTIAVRAIWFAVTHPKTLTLIVSPSLRQSMIMMDRIQSFLMAMPERLRKTTIFKMQRTVIWFRNGSQIVALPNSPNLLRGYTAHQVICDEAAFFHDDELVFYNVLYPMLATTDGTLIVSSTPWNTDSVYYKMNQDPTFSKHFVDWRQVVEAGLIKQEFTDEMRKALPLERWQREFEAQFVQDADAYFPQALITQCIDSELEYADFEDRLQGEFYVGVDFGKKMDYSVVAVIQKDGEVLKLIHMHRFPLETAYASVIGYIKTLSDRYQRVYKCVADQTGVGEYIVEDMVRAGITGTTGVTLTLQRKQEILGILKQKMQLGQLKIPYDAELIAEINIEKYELTKDGQIKFSHPENTHDDRLWALALAVYAAHSSPGGELKVETGKVW